VSEVGFDGIVQDVGVRVPGGVLQSGQVLLRWRALTSMNLASALAAPVPALTWETVSSSARRTSFSFGYSIESKVSVRWWRFPFFHSEKRTSQAKPVALETLRMLPC
jgi:hypothetical protein